MVKADALYYQGSFEHALVNYFKALGHNRSKVCISNCNYVLHLLLWCAPCWVRLWLKLSVPGSWCTGAKNKTHANGSDELRWDGFRQVLIQASVRVAHHKAAVAGRGARGQEGGPQRVSTMLHGGWRCKDPCSLSNHKVFLHSCSHLSLGYSGLRPRKRNRGSAC